MNFSFVFKGTLSTNFECDIDCIHFVTSVQLILKIAIACLILVGGAPHEA